MGLFQKAKENAVLLVLSVEQEGEGAERPLLRQPACQISH